MKKLLFISLLFSIKMYSQITFEKSYSGKGTDLPTNTTTISSADSTLPFEDNINLDIVQASDQGYFRVGSVALSSTEISAQVVRFDKSGNVLWNKAFGGAEDDFGMSLQKTIDNGIVFVGSTTSSSTGGFDILLVKTDSAGNTIWEKTFGGPGNDYASSLKVTPDGGFIIVGTTNSFGPRGMNVYIVRVDPAGNLLWSSVYGGSAEDRGNSVCLTSNGYAVIGTTKSFGAGGTDAYVINIDNQGNELFSSTYGAEDSETGKVIAQTNDGGFILGGVTYSSGAGSSDVYLTKIDISGTIEWTKTYGGINTEEIGSLVISNDNSYVLTGTSNSFGAGNSDVYIMKTDSAGNKIWANTYGGNGKDEALAIIQTLDGGYASFGYTESFTPEKERYLIKTNSSGTTYCSTNSFLPVITNPGFLRNTALSGATQVSNTVTGSLISVADSVEVIDANVMCSGLVSHFQVQGNLINNNITGRDSEVEHVSGDYKKNETIEEEKTVAVIVFPNPGTGEFHVQGMQDGDMIQVLNINGNIVYTSDKGSQIIDLSSYSKGFYYYKVIHTNRKTEEGKIILN